MAKIVDTNEVVADIGDAIHRALKQHDIVPVNVRVKVDPEQIRVVVDLVEPE